MCSPGWATRAKRSTESTRGVVRGVVRGELRPIRRSDSPAFAEESHRSNRGYLNLRNQLAKEPLGPQGKLTVIFKKWDDILFCLIKVDGSEALL